MPATLRFTKTATGRYAATGAAHLYIAVRDGKGWGLQVRALDGSRVEHAATDTVRDAGAIARAFEELADHSGPTNRLTAAITAAYSA